MSKTILITGATDGIGLATANALYNLGHTVLLHGRNKQKLAAVNAQLGDDESRIRTYCADLSDLMQTTLFAHHVLKDTNSLDVLINNAGILNASPSKTRDGLDIRFVVNTLAPYLLTQHLLPLMHTNSRVVILSSAAQAPVNLSGLKGEFDYQDHMAAYAQSKLAITIWSKAMAAELGNSGPSIIAVNPGSLLGSKMVKQGFGIAGKDLSIGADILVRAALSDEFASVSGQYYDNDSGQFANPHADALDENKVANVMYQIAQLIA